MKLISAPIDNKNLMEDSFEDMFDNFYKAPYHYEGGFRHMIGYVRAQEGSCVYAEGYAEVEWWYGANTIKIHVIAVPQQENFDEMTEGILNYYKNIFSSWQCEENPGLVVRFSEYKGDGELFVNFYFEVEDM